MKRSSSDDPELGGEYPVIPSREGLEGVPEDNWSDRPQPRAIWFAVLLCLGILSLALVMAVASCTGAGGM